MKHSPLVLAAVACVALTASCATSQSFDQLPPIDASQHPELRVSIAHYPLASRTAYVVTPSSIEVFDYNGSRWRVRTVETPAGAQVLDAAIDLARLDGEDIGCDVVDGNAVSVVAALNGTHFSFTASNPEFCASASDDEDARDIHRLLQMIERAAYAPEPVLPDGVDDPCFRFESWARASRMVRSTTPDRSVSRPLDPHTVVLQCEQRGNRRIDCVVLDSGGSPHSLVETALTYADELEMCPGEPARFLLPMTFRD